MLSSCVVNCVLPSLHKCRAIQRVQCEAAHSWARLWDGSRELLSSSRPPVRPTLPNPSSCPPSSSLLLLLLLLSLLCSSLSTGAQFKAHQQQRDSWAPSRVTSRPQAIPLCLLSSPLSLPLLLLCFSTPTPLPLSFQCVCVCVLPRYTHPLGSVLFLRITSLPALLPTTPPTLSLICRAKPLPLAVEYQRITPSLTLWLFADFLSFFVCALNTGLSEILCVQDSAAIQFTQKHYRRPHGVFTASKIFHLKHMLKDDVKDEHIYIIYVI